MNNGIYDVAKRTRPGDIFGLLGKPGAFYSISPRLSFDPRLLGGLEVWLDASDPFNSLDRPILTTNYTPLATLWRDLSGFNRNATLINGPVYNIRNKGCLEFDGTNDYANISYNSTNFLDRNFTWTVWIYGIPSGSEVMPHIGYGSGAWERLGFRYATSSAGWLFSQYANSGPPNTQDIFVGAGSSTAWTFLCVVGDFTSRRVITYRNGRRTTNGGWITSTGNVSTFVIGRTSSDFPGYINGLVGELKIFNRPLSAQEIRMDFEANRERFGA